MGAAAVLSKMKSEFKETVKFIFQPAEEGSLKGEESGAKLMGTTRALDDDMQKFINDRMKEMATVIAKVHRAEATIEISKGLPITYNHIKLTEKMLPTLQRTAGAKNVVKISATTGAEDFSFYQQQIPGLYFFLGGKSLDIKKEDASGHHSLDFVIDKSGFVLGVKTITALTLDYLND